MELDIETLQQIWSMLPPEWQRHVATLVLLWPPYNLVLWGAKHAVAKWVTSPQARYWCEALFKLGDLIAINTKSMDLHPMAEPKKKEPKK